jgi:hypothetical protein
LSGKQKTRKNCRNHRKFPGSRLIWHTKAPNSTNFVSRPTLNLPHSLRAADAVYLLAYIIRSILSRIPPAAFLLGGAGVTKTERARRRRPIKSVNTQNAFVCCPSPACVRCPFLLVSSTRQRDNAYDRSGRWLKSGTAYTLLCSLRAHVGWGARRAVKQTHEKLFDRQSFLYPLP